MCNKKMEPGEGMLHHPSRMVEKELIMEVQHKRPACLFCAQACGQKPRDR